MISPKAPIEKVAGAAIVVWLCATSWVSATDPFVGGAATNTNACNVHSGLAVQLSSLDERESVIEKCRWDAHALETVLHNRTLWLAAYAASSPTPWYSTEERRYIDEGSYFGDRCRALLAAGLSTNAAVRAALVHFYHREEGPEEMTGSEAEIRSRCKTLLQVPYLPYDAKKSLMPEYKVWIKDIADTNATASVKIDWEGILVKRGPTVDLQLWQVDGKAVWIPVAIRGEVGTGIE